MNDDNTVDRRRAGLFSLLGELPERERPVSAIKIAEERRESYILEKLVLDLNGIERVPAYLTRPTKAAGRVPAILYNHAHGGGYEIGKDELINDRSGIQRPPYGEQLARLGYASLCIDHWAFGERRGRTESEIFKTMLWQGQVMWGMMVYDSIRAVDYLTTREDIDATRLGTLGASMGSTMAWWVAALDPRIKVTVDICCLTDFHELIESRGLDGHGIYYFVPRLLKHFTTAQINGLIAPRAHLSLAGNYDPLTPPHGLDRIDRELKEVYQKAKSAEAWKLLRYDIGHLETMHMRTEIIEFMRRWL